MKHLQRRFFDSLILRPKGIDRIDSSDRWRQIYGLRWSRNFPESVESEIAGSHPDSRAGGMVLECAELHLVLWLRALRKHISDKTSSNQKIDRFCYVGSLVCRLTLINYIIINHASCEYSCGQANSTILVAARGDFFGPNQGQI